jgi:hemerythrin-like domain-containing protein
MNDPSTSAGPPGDLNGVLLVHATLRKGASDLQTAAARFGAANQDPQVVLRLWGFYERGLRQHHKGEDDVIFPLAASREPDFADIESELRKEHEAIDVLLAAADGAFGELRTGATSGRAAAAGRALGELDEALSRHLAHEETAALPIIVRVIPEAEMSKIEKGFLREIPRRDLGLSLAALDATTHDHPELHLPPVPKPALALLALIWRRQYKTLLAKAGI